MVAHLRQKTWQDNNCSIISKKSQVWRLSNIVKDMHWSVCTWWVYNEMQITWIGDLKYYKTNTNTEEKHKYKHKYKYKYKFEEEVWKSDYDSGAKLWCNRIQYKSASFCLAPRLSSLITTTSPFATKHQQYRNSKCNKRTIYKKKWALMHVFYIASHVPNIFFFTKGWWLDFVELKVSSKLIERKIQIVLRRQIIQSSNQVPKGNQARQIFYCGKYLGRHCLWLSMKPTKEFIFSNKGSWNMTWIKLMEQINFGTPQLE